MDLMQRLFAAIYDPLTGKVEGMFVPFRARTAGQARGDVLEIGAGTGANVRFYHPDARLSAVEPNPHMAKRLSRKAAQQGRRVDVALQTGQSLPYPDASFDSVVATLVLCSVPDQGRVLAEIKRVLRPGGAYYFLEHVVSDVPGIRAWQNRLTPVSRCVADGCNLNRDTESAIRQASFREVDLQVETLPRKAMPLTSRLIVGRALV